MTRVVRKDRAHREATWLVTRIDGIPIGGGGGGARGSVALLWCVTYILTRVSDPGRILFHPNPDPTFEKNWKDLLLEKTDPDPI